MNVHERSFVVSRLQGSLELSLGSDVFSGGLCSDFPDTPQNRLKSFLEEGEHSILTSCTMTVSREDQSHDHHWTFVIRTVASHELYLLGLSGKHGLSDTLGLSLIPPSTDSIASQPFAGSGAWVEGGHLGLSHRIGFGGLVAVVDYLWG